MRSDREACQPTRKRLKASTTKATSTNPDQVEYATLEWVDWFNHRRLLEPIGYVPPAEFQAAYHQKEDPSAPVRLKHPSLH